MNLNYLFTSFALNLRADGTYEPFSAEACKYAGKMTFLGMILVFAVLAVLMLVLMLFKVFFGGKKNGAKKENKAKPSTAALNSGAENDDVISAVIAASIQAYEADQAALVAVITAAVAAHIAAEDPSGDAGSFRVVSFKRASSRAWNSRK